MTKATGIFIYSLFALVFTLGAPRVASASAIECKLEDRTMAFFRDTLPNEIKALIRCSSGSRTFNPIYVATLKSAKREELVAWFKRYERSEVPNKQRTLLLEKRGKGAPDTWMEFESELGKGKKMTHYLFTAQSPKGLPIVFIYTEKSETARVRRGLIQSLMKTFRDRDYLIAIADALAD